MSDQFIDVLLKCSQAKSCERLEVIQRLWSGYGTISRYALEDGTSETVVVKHITLNKADTHPRGWNSNNSHMRKVRSYEVEMSWYQSWNQRCYVNCKTPKFLGSYSDRDEKWIILEDLDKEFPLRKSQVTFAEVKLCLSWLAHFHAAFLGEAPTGLWPVGTYWHLETRPDELGKLSHKRLKENAQFIDRKLNECSFKTLVHGDAKLANFCFSENSLKVAAVDFQYVGGGCGIKDVAYFLGSCMSGEDCELYEEELLKFYFSVLERALLKQNQQVNFLLLKQEWTNLYPVACADFMRFMLGWMPAHQKVNDYNLKMIDKSLSKFT